MSSKMRAAATLQLVVLCLVLGVEHAQGIRISGEERGAKPPSLTLRGYAHLRLNVPDGTEMFVVPGVSGELSPASFGSATVVDDPFRQSNDSASDLVGRIKGFGVYTDIASTTEYLSLYLTFLINYKNVTGSVLVYGTRIQSDTLRRLAVVGGTGDFELARGTATQQTVYNAPATDGSGAFISINEWKLTLVREPVGPNLSELQQKLPNLVVPPHPVSAGII